MAEASKGAAIVRHDEGSSRYVLELDGRQVGMASYHRAGGAVVLDHTEVDPQLSGAGLGSKLVRAALEDLRARSEHVVARCPFVAAFIASHPGYEDLVAHRAR